MVGCLSGHSRHVHLDCSDHQAIYHASMPPCLHASVLMGQSEQLPHLRPTSDMENHKIPDELPHRSSHGWQR